MFHRGRVRAPPQTSRQYALAQALYEFVVALLHVAVDDTDERSVRGFGAVYVERLLQFYLLLTSITEIRNKRLHRRLALWATTAGAEAANGSQYFRFQFLNGFELAYRMSFKNRGPEG